MCKWWYTTGSRIRGNTRLSAYTGDQIVDMFLRLEAWTPERIPRKWTSHAHTDNLGVNSPLARSKGVSRVSISVLSRVFFFFLKNGKHSMRLLGVKLRPMRVHPYIRPFFSPNLTTWTRAISPHVRVQMFDSTRANGSSSWNYICKRFPRM